MAIYIPALSDSGKPKDSTIDPSAVGLIKALARFNDTIEALDELAEHAIGFADVLDSFKPSANFVERPTKAQQIRFRSLFDTHFVKPTKESAEGEKNIGPQIGRLADELITEFGPKPWIFETINQLVKLLGRRPRSELLRQSLFLQSVAAFENLQAEITGSAHRHPIFSPKAMGKSDPEISLSKLMKHSKLDEVVDELVENHVQALMYGSFSDWCEWLNKVFGFEPMKHLPDAPYFLEMLQRRNVVAHNDCRVSRLYLERLSSKDETAKIGTYLGVPSDYLHKAIDAMSVAGLRCAILALNKLTGEEGPSLVYLSDLNFEQMVRMKWNRSREISSSLLEWDKDEEQLLIHKVNHWLSLKRIGGRSAIESEVTAWKTGPLNQSFKVARLALLDKTDDLALEVSAALASGELKPESVLSWPLLEEFRRTDSFADLLTTNKELINRGTLQALATGSQSATESTEIQGPKTNMDKKKRGSSQPDEVQLPEKSPRKQATKSNERLPSRSPLKRSGAKS
jgi:hypothetical protein